MKVDVIRVRERGEKISVEQLKRVVQVRGELTIQNRLGVHKNETVLIATLAGGPRFEMLLPALDFLRIGQLRGNVFMLSGLEEIADRKRVNVYPQAWRCSLVLPESVSPWPANYDDDEDERDAGGLMLDAAQWR